MSLARHLFLAALLVLTGLAPAAAQHSAGGRDSGPAEQARPRLPPEAATQHILALPGRMLHITALAGSVPVLDAETDRPIAEIATTAYLLDGADPRTRPIVFVTNGGPGFSSAWLQLGALGPWRVKMGDDAGSGLPSSPPDPQPNAETWLDFADLVFIDPVGTGYSRFVDPDEAVRKRLWSVDGDVQSIAAAIRRWLERHDRLASPKFLVGESYGGLRMPRVARVLESDMGVGVSGLVLVSPALDLGGSRAFDPLALVGRLPSMAAIARAKSGPVTEAGLADVEGYAAGDFLADLLRGESDAAATARVVARVADLTGLDRALVAASNGRVPVPVFLRAQTPAQIASIYDGTDIAPRAFPDTSYAREEDPVIARLSPSFSSAMVSLYQTELDWHPEGPYQLFSEQAGRSWDWGRALAPPQGISALRVLLAEDPHFRVLVAHGLFDLVTPYFADTLRLRALPPIGPAGRVRLVTYPAGHMVYSHDATRAAFRNDARALVAPPPAP